MKKSLLILPAVILTMFTTPTYAGGTGQQTQPNTVCGYLQQMSETMIRMESSMNQRLDRIESRLSQVEDDLSQVMLKTSSLDDEVGKIKKTVGDFGNDEPKQKSKKTIPQQAKNTVYMEVRLVETTTLESIPHVTKNKLVNSTNRKYHYLDKSLAKSLINQGLAIQSEIIEIEFIKEHQDLIKISRSQQSDTNYFDRFFGTPPKKGEVGYKQCLDLSYDADRELYNQWKDYIKVVSN